MSRRVVSFTIRFERLFDRQALAIGNRSFESEFWQNLICTGPMYQATIWVATRNPFVPYWFWARWDFFYWNDPESIRQQQALLVFLKIHRKPGGAVRRRRAKAKAMSILPLGGV